MKENSDLFNLGTTIENYYDGYYHFRKDVEDYPDAVAYICWSFRGPGKTYSFLRYVYEESIPFIYLKRTSDDIDLICSQSNGVAVDIDASPFVPLNRDFGWNVKPFQIKKGIGAFYNANEEGCCVGEPVGRLFSLSKVKSVKGMDLSETDFINLDEFIPQSHEIIRKKEADALLDLCLTVSRDRIARGRKPLKLVLFANSEQIACPITVGLEVLDDMAEMNATGESIRYLKDRKILLHHILPEEAPKVSESQKQDGFFQMMKGTNWAKKAYEGLFTNNDFSNVKRLSLKKMVPYIRLQNKNNLYYIYTRDDGMYYMTFSPAPCPIKYDLNKENDQKLFYANELFDLQEACIEDLMKFEKYSMYELIMNYKKYFTV